MGINERPQRHSRPRYFLYLTGIVLLPIIIVFLILAIVVVARGDWSWVSSTATFISASGPCVSTGTTGRFSCDVTVAVDGLPGTHKLHVFTDKMTIDRGTTWPVQYEKSNEDATLTTDLSTKPSTKKSILMILGVVMAVLTENQRGRYKKIKGQPRPRKFLVW